MSVVTVQQNGSGLFPDSITISSTNVRPRNSHRRKKQTQITSIIFKYKILTNNGRADGYSIVAESDSESASTMKNESI